VLAGKRTPLRNIAVLNAAAAAVVAGKAANIQEGAALAQRAIESGAAQRALERLIAITNGRG
jgi:anthranilate phosphoribosyltransferase